MMPMWIVSGVFFSSQRFPDIVQPVIRLLPLTAIIDALRGNMLQGASMAVNVDADALTPEQRQILTDFTHHGATVLTAPPG